ncbi:hypothetical protein GCM10010116_40640 [Microbispora rosea subsp. aerata]|nr:hypothetical protein [Microbispora rosea]GGO20274.1 hypothetical protein GCM10010116_40640 [Microbispora rosea subsp. aerata]GIH57199.1 hypothetical protein Mro02_41130 [Microbispora rosea subsp. aerata]GLJ84731.1 hypothetical protein GCM10017588_34590 [Microbispora rosea subsp. aerata]
MHLVVINTAGKQRYIFSSRKRKEIVGASDLIARVNGSWAQEALQATFPGFGPEWRLKDGHAAELITAGAGSVTVLVREPDAGRRLVTELTRRALHQAPGLDVCGVVQEVSDSEPLAKGRERAGKTLAASQETRPGPQSRFLRLPLVEDCESTGLPAAGMLREAPDESPVTRSVVSMAKLAHFPAALERLAADARTTPGTMSKIVDRLGLEADWVAVVHADGNGFGRLFRGLGESKDVHSARGDTYAEELRTLSRGADRCALRAFHAALDRLADEHAVWNVGGSPPVLPLVLGGDDLTVLCQGQVALPFTRHYLEAFERETAADAALRPVLARAGRKRLDAAAGVAIVKRNYPFRFAYDLAEELITAEAKQVKEWASALAFAVLLESSAPDLSRLRGSVVSSGGAVATVSPYVVGEGAGDPRAEGRRWSDLVRRVAALRRRDADSGEPLVPGNAAHDLREGLCLGADVAKARLGLLRTRFAGDHDRLEALDELGNDSGRLVWEHEGRWVTGLVDAMAALPFLGGEGETR